MAKKKPSKAKPRNERRGTPPTQMRLRPETLDALAAIAIRENLTYADQPSRAEAVRWLVDQDAKRQAAKQARKKS